MSAGAAGDGAARRGLPSIALRAAAAALLLGMSGPAAAAEGGLSALLQYVAAPVFLISFLVFIHELGHFSFAKAFGVSVPIFSFGFGRRLFGLRVGETDYRVSMLPFGGYVRMLGADAYGNAGLDEDEPEGPPPSDSYTAKKLWQRFLVMFGGPMFNLVFPVLLFTALFVIGEPTPVSEIGDVGVGSAAEASGLRRGDLIVAVDGHPTPTWVDVDLRLMADPLAPHALQVQRQDAVLELTFQPPTGGYGAAGTGLTVSRPTNELGVDDPASPAGRAGLRTGERVVSVNGAPVADWLGLERALVGAEPPLRFEVIDAEGAQRSALLEGSDWAPRSAGHRPSEAARWGLVSASIFVGAVKDSLDDEGGALPGLGAEPTPSPAKAAGVQRGDRVFAVDGAPVNRWNDLLDAIKGTVDPNEKGATPRAVRLEVVREGALLSLTLEPRVVEDIDAYGLFNNRPMVGFGAMGGTAISALRPRPYRLDAAVVRATKETALISAAVVERVGELITRKASVKASMGGPLAMAQQSVAAAQQGIFTYARMMGMLSISLGVLNLLPVPIFDGGQLIFLLMEGVRGRPVSGALRERTQQIGVIFVIVLMAMVFVNDLSRIVSGWLGGP